MFLLKPSGPGLGVSLKIQPINTTLHMGKDSSHKSFANANCPSDRTGGMVFLTSTKENDVDSPLKATRSLPEDRKRMTSPHVSGATDKDQKGGGKHGKKISCQRCSVDRNGKGQESW